jgi:hypothetical protein
MARRNQVGQYGTLFHNGWGVGKVSSQSWPRLWLLLLSVGAQVTQRKALVTADTETAETMDGQFKMMHIYRWGWVQERCEWTSFVIFDK